MIITFALVCIPPPDPKVFTRLFMQKLVWKKTDLNNYSLSLHGLYSRNDFYVLPLIFRK